MFREDLRVILDAAIVAGAAVKATVAISSLHAVDKQLRLAIVEKRLIHVRYGGRVRLAEPHDYGIKNGSVKLLVYQVRVAGERREPGWRLLDVSKIDACLVSEDTFPGSRGDSSQRHIAWDELFVRVG